jgi:hypothetical protein
MAGIPLLINGKTELHAAVWADAKRVPTIFIAVARDGSTGLMHPERVSDLLGQIWHGDMDEDDAWDHLLIKTPDMEFPVPCFVETNADEDSVWATVRTGSRAGVVRYRMEI